MRHFSLLRVGIAVLFAVVTLLPAAHALAQEPTPEPTPIPVYGGEPYDGQLSDGTTFAVYPSATFGDLALFMAVASIAAMQIITITMMLLIRNRIIKWMN